MDGRCPSYPEYKPSGVDWLGEIPAHWDVRRLKFVARIYNGATPSSSEEKYWNGDIPWVTPDDLGKLDGVIIRETKRRITREGYLSCGTTLVPAGSLVMSTRAPIGHLAIAAMDFCTNQGCRAIVPFEQIDNLYLYFSLKTAVPQLEAYGSGSTFRELSAIELANFSIPFPPLPEQRAIAAYLDRQTARIDALIAHKRDLLHLLERQRAALISHAVTKGLNPDVPLKPSGVDWLGEIPAHWDVRRLKFVAGINPSKSEVSHLPENTEVSFLPMERVGNGILDLELTKPLKEIKQGFTYFRDGDVIVAKITPSFENGKGALAFGLANGIGFGTTELHVIRATSLIEQQFVYYLTLSHQFRGMGETQMYGTAGQKRVPDRFINDFPTPLPPLPEQRAIAAYLDRQTARIDRLKAEIESSIELLGRYRAALISAAVTGKIRVIEDVENVENVER